MLRYLGICLLGGGLVSGQAAGEAHLTGHCPTDYDCNEDRDHSVLKGGFAKAQSFRSDRDHTCFVCTSTAS